MHFPEQQLTTYLRVFLPDARIDGMLDEIAQAAIESDVADTITFFSLAHWLMDADDRRTPAMEAVVLVEEVGLSDADVAVILDQDVVEVERAVAQAWDASSSLTDTDEEGVAEPEAVEAAGADVVSVDLMEVQGLDQSDVEDVPPPDDDETAPDSPTSVLETTDTEVDDSGVTGAGVENDRAASTVLDAAPDVAGDDVVPVASASRWSTVEVPDDDVSPEHAQADAAAILAAVESATGKSRHEDAEKTDGEKTDGEKTDSEKTDTAPSEPAAPAEGRFDSSLILAPLVATPAASPDVEDSPADDSSVEEAAGDTDSDEEEQGAVEQEANADGADTDDEGVEADADADTNVVDRSDADSARRDPVEDADSTEDADRDEDADAAAEDATVEDATVEDAAIEDDDGDQDAAVDDAAPTSTSDVAATPAPRVDDAEVLANLPGSGPPPWSDTDATDGQDTGTADGDAPVDGSAGEPASSPDPTTVASPGMSVFGRTLSVLALIGVAVLGFAVFSPAGQDRLTAQGFDPLTAFLVVVGFLGLGVLLLYVGGRRRTVRAVEDAGRSWSRATPTAEVARASNVVTSDADEDFARFQERTRSAR